MHLMQLIEHGTHDTKTAHFLFICVCASVRVVMYFFLVLFQKLFFVVYWALKSSYIKRVKIRCELILTYKWKVRRSRSSNFTGMCLYDTNPKELQILLRNTFGPRSSSILVYHFLSMHFIFALPGWRRECIKKKEGVSHFGLLFL